MKILVFGSTGMLGHTLIKYLQSKKSINVEFTVRDERKQDICKLIFGRKANFLVDAYSFNGDQIGLTLNEEATKLYNKNLH